MSTFVNEEQPKNARSLMEVNPAGIVTLSRLTHPENAFLPSVVTVGAATCSVAALLVTLVPKLSVTTQRYW